MKTLLHLALSLTLIFSCTTQAQETEHYKRVDNTTWDQAISEAGDDAQIIDVRTPGEYDNGTLENAVNIDFMGDGFMEKMGDLDKSQTVFIFCQSGGRSAKACKKLEAAGFEDIIELKGGYSGYN